MAQKIPQKTLWIVYNGYIGDEQWNGFSTAGIHAKCVVADSKMIGLKYVSWLSQKGFGPGYFNNSGRYAIAYKIKVPEGVELKERLQVKMYEDAAAHAESWKDWKAHARRQNKANPY